MGQVNTPRAMMYLLLSLTLLLAVLPAADAEIVKYHNMLNGGDCLIPQLSDSIELDGLRGAYGRPYDKNHDAERVPPFKTVVCDYLGRDDQERMQWDCEAIGVEQDVTVQLLSMTCDRCTNKDMYTISYGIIPNTCHVILNTTCV